METKPIVQVTNFKEEIASKQLSVIFACTFLEFCFVLLIFSLLCTLLFLLYGILHVNCTHAIRNTALNTNLPSVLSSKLLGTLKFFVNKGTWKHFILAPQHNISLLTSRLTVLWQLQLKKKKKKKPQLNLKNGKKPPTTLHPVTSSCMYIIFYPKRALQLRWKDHFYSAPENTAQNVVCCTYFIQWNEKKILRSSHCLCKDKYRHIFKTNVDR